MLLESFGGEPLPACGFGFGDAVIVELLKDLDLLPPLQSVVDVVIFPYGEEQRYDPGLGFRVWGSRFRV
jgi:histidyl-tRNA synthetase